MTAPICGVRNTVLARNGEKTTITRDAAAEITKRKNKPELRYRQAPVESEEFRQRGMKNKRPLPIPRSRIRTAVKTRLFIAENIPKSEEVSKRKVIKVNRKANTESAILPVKRI